jgi:DNA polymerase-3 subunit delta'
MLFSDVLGMEEQKSALRREVLNDTVSHAKLFLGKTGYGGLPLAMAFTQYLYCQDRTPLDSCGVCSSCQKVRNLQLPDLHFSFPVVQSIQKTSTPLLKEWREQLSETYYFSLNQWVRRMDEKERKPIISTEESQDILKKLSLKAFEGGYKVMIIWMAEEMNSSCSNKLLKILEEPTKDTIFILISEHLEKLLPTIVSRTQTLRIPRLDSDNVREFLRNQGVNKEDLETLVTRAEGDLMVANDLIDLQGFQSELVNQFIQLMRVCYKKDVIQMLNWAENLASCSREQQKTFLEYTLHMFRQSILKNYTENQLTRVSFEEEAFLSNFSKYITGNNISDLIKTFNDAYYHIERNANAKILFTNTCFKVMRFIHHS